MLVIDIFFCCKMFENNVKGTNGMCKCKKKGNNTKSWPFVYTEYTIKIGQVFLNHGALHGISSAIGGVDFG